MKCRYKFKIEGHMKVADLKPVQIRGMNFQFVSEKGLITHLIVTVPANDANDIPKVIENPMPGVKAHINVPSPIYLFVKREVRAIEALLSVFGLHSIDVNNFEIEWLPENEEERKKLKISRFATYRGEIDPSDQPPLSFDLVARSIIAADDAVAIETSLNFFRKGLVDFSETRYIEAFYDYYFFLESVFGDGKTKNYAVKEAFKNSPRLNGRIDEILKGTNSKLMIRHDQRSHFEQKFKNKTVEEIIDYIVELRGYLHHHSIKRKDNWHPDDHYRFELDALLLHNIAYYIAMDIALPYLYEEKTLKIYQEMFGFNKNVQ
jgi:hypothetical protein